MSKHIDIVTRIRNLRSMPSLIGYCGWAAIDCLDDTEAEIIRLRAEVERLRNGAVDARETVQPTLSDAEREALSNAALWLVALQSADDDAAGPGDPRAGECAATLRALLARHGVKA